MTPRYTLFLLMAITCVACLLPSLVFYGVEPHVLAWLFRHHPSIFATIRDSDASTILFVLLYLPSVTIIALIFSERITVRSWWRLAAFLVPNLPQRVAIGQEAIDAYIREILEHDHQTGRCDLTGWNGYLRISTDWGLRAQTRPKGPIIPITSPQAEGHMPALDRSGAFEGLSCWQRRVVLQFTYLEWTSQKPRYTAHEQLRLRHQRMVSRSPLRFVRATA